MISFNHHPFITCRLVTLLYQNTWWRHQMETFPRNWPFVWGIHRSPVNSPQKGQWRGALMFSLICAWITDWVNNREAGDLRRHRGHYDVTVMIEVISLIRSRAQETVMKKQYGDFTARVICYFSIGPFKVVACLWLTTKWELLYFHDFVNNHNHFCYCCCGYCWYMYRHIHHYLYCSRYCYYCCT